MRSRPALLRLSGLLVLLAGSGAAQPLPPPCTPARAGQHACMVQQDCECRFERGGTLLGQPAGWRWSCSLLSGCEAITPAAPPPRGLPDGFSYAPGTASGTDDGVPPWDPWNAGRGRYEDRGFGTRAAPYGYGRP